MCDIAIQAESQGSIGRVDGDAHRNGFAVPQRKAGHCFQFVRRPVAEIQRAGLEHFQWIAAVGNVFQVQLGRAANDGQTDRHVAAANPGGILADLLEQPGVLQQRNFDRLGKPCQEIAPGQGLQHAGVVNHRPRHREGSQPVLRAEEIDAIFHPNPGVGLSERGCGQSNQPQAAMGNCGRESHGIQDRTAANDHNIAASIQSGRVELREHRLDAMNVVLHGFAAGNDARRSCKDQPVCILGGKAADLVRQFRLGRGNVGIQPELHPRSLAIR